VPPHSARARNYPPDIYLVNDGFLYHTVHSVGYFTFPIGYKVIPPLLEELPGYFGTAYWPSWLPWILALICQLLHGSSAGGEDSRLDALYA
jgi:hypothetical protein